MRTDGMAFPKPKDVAKSKKAKHSRRNKTRERRRWIKELDAHARHEVVEVRDQNTCQRCGRKQGEWNEILKRPVVIQWCHVQTREYYILRWEPANSFAGCDQCHKWFDQNKVLSLDWFAKKFPERWELIKRVLNSGNTKTSDAWVRGLLQELCAGQVEGR